ncbi:hypothetical protein [Ramlibacter sp.]|uniref:hypothetical protein n=1 Tax=Ramlibacter sp. TaxID=1917967 RepID=UPI002FC652ED
MAVDESKPNVCMGDVVRDAGAVMHATTVAGDQLQGREVAMQRGFGSFGRTSQTPFNPIF